MLSSDNLRPRRRWAAGPVIGLLVAGCYSSNDGGGCQSPSSLTGNGTFSYECTDPSDRACDATGIPVVAVGGSFRLKFVDSKDKSAAVDTVSRAAVETLGSGEFRALRAGRVGFFATADDVLVDAIRVRAAEPATLDLSRPPPHADAVVGDGVLRLPQSEGALTLAAVARSADGRELSGTFTPSWTTEDPAIASIEHILPGRATIVPHAIGDTTLSVKYRDAKLSVPVHVRAFPGVDDLDASDSPDASDSADASDAGLDDGGTEVLDAGGDAGTDGGAQ